jgi:hypothetical protein
LSQLTTLIWLKLRLFRNSLRSSKAVVNRLASILGVLVAFAFALIVALFLGIAAFVLTSPEGIVQTVGSRSGRSSIPPTEFILFSLFSFTYLMWATLPLSVGSGRQFDPGRLLMYPISLSKLFAIDFISEVTALQSIFAIPSMIAVALGVGLGTGRMSMALAAMLPAVIFGMALSKWLSVAVGSLLRRRRTGGETLIALIGVAAGLGGALVGQLAPAIFKHADSFKGLRWTPPGAAAFALTQGLREGATGEYLLALATLTAYATILVAVTFWIARRAVMGAGGAKRKGGAREKREALEKYTGWELPLLSPQLSAVVEKELRYVTRNAQVRMMVLMPLILIVVRLINTTRLRSEGYSGSAFLNDLLYYGDGLITTGGVLYVFLILTGISCNQFAFEEGGMRALILSPVDRKRILIGKNIAMTIVALVFSSALLIINELVFSDLTVRGLLFAALAFVYFSMMVSVIGNWLSIRFPKRMKFGKRLNVSGVVGLLLIPMIIVLGAPPIAAATAGYFTRSVFVVYVTLTGFAAIAVCSYLLLIGSQGRSLRQREVEILEAVREPTDD